MPGPAHGVGPSSEQVGGLAGDDGELLAVSGRRWPRSSRGHLLERLDQAAQDVDEPLLGHGLDGEVEGPP
jgi:hypothetical protein